MARVFPALIFSLLICTAVPNAFGGDNDQPNIIYIFTDDLASGMVGFTNPNAVPLTPNLDALASAGLQFNRAYANAICSPSRGSLYTGYHLGHTINDQNVENFRNQDIMPGEMVKEAGYATAIFGKWGFGSTTGTNTGSGGVETLRLNPQVTNVATLPTSHGYDFFVGYLNHVQAHRFFIDPLWQADSSSSTGVGFFVTGNNAGDNFTNTFEGYTDDHHTREAMQFISNSAAADTPFLLQMHFNSPHPPYSPGSRLDYDFEGNPRVWDQDYQGMGLSMGQRELSVMITRMDEHVGALVNRLSDPNQDGSPSDSILTNTVIMFTSDNGGEVTGGLSLAEFEELGGNCIYGTSLRGGKRDLFEGGVRVPAFAFWAGTIAPNQTTDEIIDLADFMPTVAELAGIDAPVGLDGVSYAGLLTGEGMVRRRPHHVWEHHEGDGHDPDGRNARWSVLKNGFKLIGFSNNTQDFYNLNLDPEESQPLNVNDFPDIHADLLAIAAAEGIRQPEDGYSVLHFDWTGSDGDDTDDPSNWSGYDPLHELWTSVINNNQSIDSTLTFADRDFLGLEVRGDAGKQSIRIDSSATLDVHNLVRIADNGRIHLDDGNLASNRWVDVQSGGELTGDGNIQTDLYNWGTIAPGLPVDFTVEPPPNMGVNTGIVDAIEFDFAGVQDNAPLNSTSVLNQYMDISLGFSFGPGTFPQNQANAGNEFNVAGWNTDALQGALTSSDYVHFEVEPLPGIEMLVSEVTFRAWRNNAAAARSYATLISANGFDAADPIGLWEDFFVEDDGNPNNGSDGIGIQHQVEFTAVNNLDTWTEDPLEVRFYGWDTIVTQSPITLFDPNAGSGSEPTENVIFDAVFGDTVQTLIDATANPGARGSNFVIGSPGTPTEIGGVTFQSNNAQTFSTGDEVTIMMFAGNDFTGVDPTNITPAGLAAAPGITSLYEETFQLPNVIPDQNFLIIEFTNSFTVDSSDVLGLMVFTNTEFSQLEGTGSGGRLLYRPNQAVSLSGGTRNLRFSILGPATSGGGSPANTHINAVSMQASFRSVMGGTVEADETGLLEIAGDFFLQENSTLAMQVGDDGAGGLEHDQVLVAGTVDLTGELSIELLPDFAPLDGMVIPLLQATALTGQFSNASFAGVPDGVEALVEITGDSVNLVFSIDADTTASNVNVFRGVQLGGTLADSFESDDSYLTFNPGFTLNSIEAPVWLIFDGTLTGSPSSLSVVVESNGNTPGLTVTTEAFDFTTMSYDVIDQQAESFNSDSVKSIDITSGISNYVDGSGSVRTRVGWRRTGFTILFPWEARLDQVIWSPN